MREKLQQLSEDYQALDWKSWTVSQASQHADLKRILKELHRLMQDVDFFHVLFADGFQVGDRHNGVIIETIWTLASPIVSLLYVYHEMYCGIIKDSEDSDHFMLKDMIPNYQDPTVAICGVEKQWTCTWRGISFEHGEQLTNSAPQGEVFLGVFKYGLGNPYYELNQYSQLIKLFDSKAEKTSAIVYLYDGVFTECLFYLKDENGKRVLTSGSYVHQATKDITKRFEIKLVRCPNIQVTHNGNCSVHSERNVNAVLLAAHESEEKSVYQTLCFLENNQLDLTDRWVNVEDLGIEKLTQKEWPSPETLMRLLAVLGHYCFYWNAQGWIEFCREKNIHPKNILKVSSSHLPQQLQITKTEEKTNDSLQQAFNQLTEALKSEKNENTKGRISKAAENLQKILFNPKATKEERINAIKAFESVCGLSFNTKVKNAVCLFIFAAVAFVLGFSLGALVGVDKGIWTDVSSAMVDLFKDITTDTAIQVLSGSALGALAVCGASYYVFFKPSNSVEVAEKVANIAEKEVASINKLTIA